MSLVLVGLPMSGKTSVGTILADRLSLPFIDTDELITKSYAKKTGTVLSPRQIYIQEGEKFFRSLEKLQIASLPRSQTSVIAIGGGSLLDHENAKVLSLLGTLVYLKTLPSVIWRRMSERGIPAYLDPLTPEKAFYALAKKREPLYESMATITIDASDLTKEKIVESIITESNYGQ